MCFQNLIISQKKSNLCGIIGLFTFFEVYLG